MILPLVVTICISIADIFNIIAKKICTCTNTKLHDYTVKLHTATSAYSKLSSLIYESLNNGKISYFEFAEMNKMYEEGMTVIESTSNLDFANNFDLEVKKNE